MGANLSSTALLHKAVLESELHALEDQYRCDNPRNMIKQWLENRISKLSETENDQ